MIRDTAAQMDGASFYASYGGRGMFGKQCIGLSGSRTECNVVVGEVLKQLMLEAFSSDPDSDVECEHQDVRMQWVDALLNSSEDQLGLGMIVYWPKIPPIDNAGYKDGKCPDCGSALPADIKVGNCCKRCGHIFCGMDEEES
jgi:hypothetical protein